MSASSPHFATVALRPRLMPPMSLADPRTACAPASALPAALPHRPARRPSPVSLPPPGESPSLPPLSRSSMPVQRWQGFLRSMRRCLVDLSIGSARQPKPRWEQAAVRRRAVLLGGVLLCSGIAVALMASASPAWSVGLLVRLVLLAVLTGWVAAGFLTALMGALVILRGDPVGPSAADADGQMLDPGTRTAIIMPICNEQVARVFAGLRATCESLLATGHAQQFDIFVLSDSSDDTVASEEFGAWRTLRTALGDRLALFYRRRQRRVRRKAGNVADFCRRWGRDYDYFIVLDADSVMSGDCLLRLVKLMARNPRAGILQTAPATDGMDSLHARMQQFGSRMAGRLFAAGMSYWQLGESHYWGHNAILRTDAFLRYCGLAPLPGRGGLSGDILSHDFVEAALMRRAGYEVWMVPDLEGSYEQQPPNLAEELRRDRRWCQGNLMNLRLLAEPGLASAHRWMLAAGALSYLVSPLWLIFLLPVAVAWQADGLSPQALLLFAFSASLLLVPKAIALGLALTDGRAARRGGHARLLVGALLEALWSLLLAPVRMLAHTLFCLAALTGIAIRWQSPPREAEALGLADAMRQFGLFTGLAAAASVCGLLADPAVALWLLPVTLPLFASPWLAALGSREELGRALRRRGLLNTPEEIERPTLLRRTQALARLRVQAAGRVQPTASPGAVPGSLSELRRA